MRSFKLHITVPLFLLMGAFFTLSPFPATAQTCDCTDTADPPFLAAGVNPNMLIMVDNSASMYDIAYADADGTVCYDDSYNNGSSYLGYFDVASWYSYSFANNRFESAAAGACAGGAGTTAYSNAYVCVVTHTALVNGNNVTVVDSFKATGNFLNWATASKFDIEKLVLTGGKYGAGALESEGRGCSGNSYIKQVGVTSGATNYKLVLGIRSDYNNEDAIDTTLIDIFTITTSGFVYSRCQDAIALMMGPPGGFGQVKQAVLDCMNYTGADQTQHSKQALIESLHDCWYLDKHGDWPGGGPQGFNFTNWCSGIYNGGLDPRQITPAHEAYICYGNSTNADHTDGFIGECWTPPGSCSPEPCGRALTVTERCTNGFIEHCTQVKGNGECKAGSPWAPTLLCVGGGALGAWKTDAQIAAMGMGWATLDDCITAARERFCGYIEVPEVVDPSDLTMSTGETWNIPAMLMSQGASGQLGNPIATIKGFIKKDTAPSGILQQYADKMRIGAMAFNYDGAKSECSRPEPYVTYDCDNPGIKDGSYLVQPIGNDTPTLVNNINLIKARAWTPLAEAVYNAVGYYTQRADLRLDAGDFPVNSPPITAYCEKNNLLMITDGASTADLNPSMVTLASSAAAQDGDTDNATGCGDLYGSTYFDDMTHYAWTANIFAGSPYSDPQLYQKISTFIVVPGTPRDTGVSNECNPKILLQNAAANGGTNAPYIATNPADLKNRIEAALKEALSRAAAGSAASVIAATRSGEGAVYQAIFWPSLNDPAGNPTVGWGGEVHALLINSRGEMYSDEDGSKTLTPADQRVVFFYDNASSATMACFGDVSAAGVCSGTKKGLHEVKYLWSAAEWLAGIDDANIVSNRAAYISAENRRFIFTWNDLNNNGAVDAGAGLDSNEVLSFVTALDWAALPVSSRPVVPRDFGVATDAEVDTLVNWIRGKDTLADPTLRKRLVPKPPNFAAGLPANITWRLGDVIHSTPTVVGRPAESFHILYRDDTFADYLNQYQNRRNVIYFGGNDGMLHAVNGGFFNETTKGFCRSPGCTNEFANPELGAELWAYVPYNLLPHLHCLKNPNYLHKYFMDLKPRIFDVQIFTPDADHPHGWGTILVAGMRQGGGKVDTGQVGDTRKFTSSYVVLDITNPEKAPVLLGEMTFDPTSGLDMGHTVSLPGVAPMKEGATSKYYLLMGSGPTDVDASGFVNWGSHGTSNQKPRIGVFPLDALTTGSKVFRVPATAPNAGSEAGSYELTASGNGFVGDISIADYNLVPEYRADAIYFGTTEGNYASKGGTWTGKLYRWVTNTEAHIATPEKWGKNKTDLGAPGVMFNPARPIKAGPIVGYDGSNFWLYFGTGRFLHKDDKTDASSNAQESFYGLREPLDCNRNFTWAPVAFTDALTPPAATDLPGSRGLLRTDQIIVPSALTAQESILSCVGGGTGCLPAGVVSFADLLDYTVGQGCPSSGNYTGTDGWYYKFPAPRERNLGQPTLFGGLLTFTTYQPFDDICRPEGEAYLYAIFYQSGSAWYKNVFSTAYTGPRIDIGRGLAETPNIIREPGEQSGAKVFIQTSTGAIVEINEPNLPIKNTKSGRMSWRSE